MNNEIKKLNDNLINFWNSQIVLSEDDKKALQNSNIDYKDIAPSKKLFDEVEKLGSCNKVLDYGCGSGWASIILAKSGCPDITSCDVGENIIDTLNCYLELFDVKDKVKSLCIPLDWLKREPSEVYDGIVCSNVLDVVPIEVSKEIISDFSRITKKGSEIVIGLNYYINPDVIKERNIELIDGMYLIMDGVLRLTNLSDDAWSQMFSPFFEVKKLDYFAWQGEAKETRRLFILKKK